MIIHQGIEEGVLTTPYPEHVGEVVMSVTQAAGETLGRLLLSSEGKRDNGRIESTVAVYTDALERVLGAPSGSLPLVDTETLKEWGFFTE